LANGSGMPDGAADAILPEPLLGVHSSLGGKRWLQRPVDERSALMLSQRLGLSEIVGRVLASRGITPDNAEAYLSPTLRQDLPDPSIVTDMDIAAERITSAIMQGEKIGIFGDYDVDGATSSALLKRFFDAVGGRTTIYIPDRLKEGYGPNGPALLELKQSGASVVITVDCGTMAHEPLTVAQDAGLDVIVVDHHAAEANLPPAVAIVNPNRLDDDSGQNQLAAVGVAFLVIVAVNRELRSAGWYKTRTAPDLTEWLDIVALGTVCDVVPLTGVNRAFVTQGLKVMAGRRNPGIRALADVGRVDETPGTFHLGFVLGPRVNAGGRVGASDLGARLLSTNDVADATEIAHRLDGFNTERKAIEDGVLQQAIDQLESGAFEDARDAIVIAAGENWHPGVVGIVASRLKERYNRPACVVSLNSEAGTGTGSGRSITGVDLGAAIIAARQSGLLLKGGGHQMAAGFTVERDKLKDFHAFLNERISKTVEKDGIVPTLSIDSAIGPGGITTKVIEELEQVSPFGSGNPEPRFVVPSVRIAHASVVGTDHLRLDLENPDGRRTRAIAFRCMDRPLGQALLQHGGLPFHLVGKLRLNNWQGRSYPQIQIEDAAPA
jgi:single-stranded-DNA-specific exonuclease